jgi:radical SAM protein with 4Fe4S-binding SPASM domain
MVMSKWILRQYKDSSYFVLFDKENGTLIRKGKNNKDPFWNKRGPELLDISITNYCERNCSFCYRNSNRNGKHMSLENYEYVIKQASRIGTLQVALGGGNPNQHPDFIDILKITKKYGLIPSYTTNGQGLTPPIYKATKKYCGAIAVSWYPPYTDAIKVIKKCKENNLKVNIHVMLNKETIVSALELINEYRDLLKDINAIIFLNYKPINSSKSITLRNSELLYQFVDSVLNTNLCKIGFDSCMISFLVQFSDKFFTESIEFCEAGRFSAFLSEDLEFYPCSFLKGTDVTGVDLKEKSLHEAWVYSEQFRRLREKLSTPGNQKNPIIECFNCDKYNLCHGGCQIFDINACREER